MSPDGDWVAAWQGPSIEIRGTKTGEQINTLKVPGQMSPLVVVFSTDGDSLLTAGSKLGHDNLQQYPRMTTAKVQDKGMSLNSSVSKFDGHRSQSGVS